MNAIQPGLQSVPPAHWLALAGQTTISRPSTVAWRKASNRVVVMALRVEAAWVRATASFSVGTTIPIRTPRIVTAMTRSSRVKPLA